MHVIIGAKNIIKYLYYGVSKNISFSKYSKLWIICRWIIHSLPFLCLFVWDYNDRISYAIRTLWWIRCGTFTVDGSSKMYGKSYFRAFCYCKSKNVFQNAKFRGMIWHIIRVVDKVYTIPQDKGYMFNGEKLSCDKKAAENLKIDFQQFLQSGNFLWTSVQSW